MRLEEFLKRANLKNLHRRGAGYLACCPAHEDRHPSLSICEGREGRILLRCWAGCATASVLAIALGLSFADLFEER